MKQKFFIVGSLIFLIFLLVGLNAVSYVQKEKQADTELLPNRSSFNSGVTGTRAFYELLSETGRKVVRWQQPPDALLNNKNAPQTFVIIGSLKREFTDAEASKLLQWVSEGGRLIVIDRKPPEKLVVPTYNWKLFFDPEEDFNEGGANPADTTQITANIAAAIPIQPTLYTKGVNSVQLSRLASSITFERFEPDFDTNGIGSATPAPVAARTPASIADDDDHFNKEQLKDEEIISAPVSHLSNQDKNLLVDIPYGAGQIVFLSDPFIISNGGLKLADNVQLGINLVASRQGTIAFDEYHQGFGTNNNRFLQYFAGTPVVSIFIQAVLLIALIFFSQSRRFARAVPENVTDRLSKLEYVSAMAELQQRTKAFDLALENIYNDFRRRVSRLFGVDNFTVTRKQLANLIAERTKFDRNDVEDVMFKCEEIIHGERTNKKEVTKLASRLREFEEKLGLQRQRRQRNVV